MRSCFSGASAHCRRQKTFPCPQYGRECCQAATYRTDWQDSRLGCCFKNTVMPRHQSASAFYVWWPTSSRCREWYTGNAFGQLPLSACHNKESTRGGLRAEEPIPRTHQTCPESETKLALNKSLLQAQFLQIFTVRVCGETRSCHCWKSHTRTEATGSPLLPPWLKTRTASFLRSFCEALDNFFFAPELSS